MSPLRFTKQKCLLNFYYSCKSLVMEKGILFIFKYLHFFQFCTEIKPSFYRNYKKKGYISLQLYPPRRHINLPKIHLHTYIQA